MRRRLVRGVGGRECGLESERQKEYFPLLASWVKERLPNEIAPLQNQI